jgi:hypothetical protein
MLDIFSPEMAKISNLTFDAMECAPYAGAFPEIFRLI